MYGIVRGEESEDPRKITFTYVRNRYIRESDVVGGYDSRTPLYHDVGGGIFPQVDQCFIRVACKPPRLRRGF
jgi:hypothetical protein